MLSVKRFCALTFYEKLRLKLYNEVIWLSFAIFDLTAIVLIYRYFGKTGLYALIPFNLILCNIQVLKTITLFGMTTTLGNILYISVFLTTNILNEFHGKQAARTAVRLGFVMLLLGTLYMQIALVYIPDPSDFMQKHLVGLFSFMPRIALASLTAYLCSQAYIVWAYHFLRVHTGGRFLWLRNIVATLSSQIIDSAIFCIIAFVGLFETGVLLQVLLTTFIIKAMVTCLDTPFLYLARFAHRLRVQHGLEQGDSLKA